MDVKYIRIVFFFYLGNLILYSRETRAVFTDIISPRMLVFCGGFPLETRWLLRMYRVVELGRGNFGGDLGENWR